MTPESWIAIAGLLFATGSVILGKVYGYGKVRQKLSSIERDQNIMKDGLDNIEKEFSNCQKTSERCRAETTIKTTTHDKSIDEVRLKIEGHVQNRGEHTDQEWRETTIHRIEIIAATMDKRMEDHEKNIHSTLKTWKQEIINAVKS